MSANKHLPHLLVIPEDDANRDLVIGFRLVFSTRQIHTEAVAGDWTRVLETFKTDHVRQMEKYPQRCMILLIDFDGKKERLDQAKAEIPQPLIDRVFILGAWTNPEDLRRAGLGSFETIGSKVAKDCQEATETTVGHALLQHNADELARLRERIRPILLLDA